MTRESLYELLQQARWSKTKQENFVADLERVEAYPKIQVGDKLYLYDGTHIKITKMIPPPTAEGNYAVEFTRSCKHAGKNSRECYFAYPTEYEINNIPRIADPYTVKLVRA